VQHLDDHEALFVAGCAATGATLAAGHFFRWWKPLGRLTAYAFGCVAILLGQGVLLKFNKTWRRLCAIVGVAGATVGGSYLYDFLSSETSESIARSLVEDRGDVI